MFCVLKYKQNQIQLLKLLLFIVAFLLLVNSALTLQGCATSSSSKVKYAAASAEFTSLSKAYNNAFLQADNATRAKWHKEIDPAFDACDAALDAWKGALYAGKGGDAGDVFEKAFDALIALLTKYNVVEVKR